jgi:hypothetical protein
MSRLVMLCVFGKAGTRSSAQISGETGEAVAAGRVTDFGDPQPFFGKPTVTSSDRLAESRHRRCLERRGAIGIRV